MNKQNTILIHFIALICFPADAFAYLDPGTGSVLLQGLLGAVVAGFYFLKLYWHRLLSFLGIKNKREIDFDPANSEEDVGNRNANEAQK